MLYIRVFFWQAFFCVIFYGLFMLAVRLHMTQLAYQFDDRKAYERSLMEEQQRMRSFLTEQLSLTRIEAEKYQTPDPSQVIRIP